MIGPIWAVISFYLRAPWLLLLLRSIESWADLSLHLHTTYQVGWWVLGRGHSLLFLWGKQFFDIKSSLLPKLGKFNFFFFCQKLSKKKKQNERDFFHLFLIHTRTSSAKLRRFLDSNVNLMGQTRPLFRLFLLSSNKHYDFCNKWMWKMSKCPSSIQRRDQNPQPFEHESSPTTTRPGLQCMPRQDDLNFRQNTIRAWHWRQICD